MIDLFQPLQKRSSAANPERWLVDAFGGGWMSKAGMAVTPDTATSLSAVYACVQVRSQTLASLPLKLFKRGKGGEKSLAVEHPGYSLMASSPHPQLTSLEFREIVNGQADLRDCAYAQIVRDGGGRLVRLVPLHPDRVQPVRAETYNSDGIRPIFYDVTNAGFGGTERLSEDQILVINNFPEGGPLRRARDAVGLALAADGHASKMFSNGARPFGALEIPAKLDDDAKKNLRSTWQVQHGGVENRGTVALLEQGIKFHEIGIDNQELQLLESRKYSRNEIASLWRVPPHKIGDLERATFSNIEQQSIEFVQDCMLPLCIRWEQRLDMSLLTAEERGTYFYKFNLAGLLRGDTPSRYGAYRIGLGRAGEPGWLTVNDIRETEDMNPVKGGDTLFSGIAPSEPPKAITRCLFPLITDAIARALRKEAKAVRAIVKRADAAAELEKFYADHRRYLIDVIAPLTATMRNLGAEKMPEPVAVAAQIVADSRADLGVAPAEGDALDSTLAVWESTRAARVATSIIDSVA